MQVNVNEQLEKISKSLMLSEPFYGLFLIMLNKEWRLDISTAGVSKKNINFQLAINPDFWQSLNDDQKIGLLKHELMHITYHHLMYRDTFENKELFNIAADLTINQRIKDDMLPPGGLTLESFPEIVLDKYKETKYYYDELEKAHKQKSSPTLESLLDQMKDNDLHVSHNTWKEFEDLDESTKRLLEKQANHIIKEAAEQIKKSRGNLPAEVVDILKKIDEIQPEKFDWRGYLRRFAGGSIKVYTKKLRRKYNKRYEDNPGLKIKPKKHILVAIDTSGSVSKDELNEFMNEIHHIHKTGSDVTIVQCDAAIQNIQSFNPKIDVKIHGRGGTAFDPVIEYYNLNKKKYTSLIYFTDGECNCSVDPMGRCLWVLSSRSHENNSLPGQVIKLN